MHSTAMTQRRKIAQNRIWHLLSRGTPRHFSNTALVVIPIFDFAGREYHK